VVFLLFLLFFQLKHLFLFWFSSIFHLYCLLHLNEYFVHLLLPPLLNSSFTSFLYSLPISHFYISLFYPLHFSCQSNFGTHYKNVLFLFQYSHTSHITSFVQCLLSTYIWSIWLHILLPGDHQVTLWMFLCWYHVPMTAKFLPSAKFTIHFPLSFVSSWRLDINRTFSNFSVEVS
jgi:hypothetical protein